MSKKSKNITYIFEFISSLNKENNEKIIKDFLNNHFHEHIQNNNISEVKVYFLSIDKLMIFNIKYYNKINRIKLENIENFNNNSENLKIKLLKSYNKKFNNSML